MSTESVRQFFSVVSSDSALKEKLASATDSVNFVQIAEDSGYSFTLEDLQAYIAQHLNDELSEEQLEAVAGGGAYPSSQNMDVAWLGNLGIAWAGVANGVIQGVKVPGGRPRGSGF